MFPVLNGMAAIGSSEEELLGIVMMGTDWHQIKFKRASNFEKVTTYHPEIQSVPVLEMALPSKLNVLLAVSRYVNVV